MPRVVKEEEFTGKRNEILDAALRLVYSKGYERMTIQDILDALDISKGAFYHYFDSKSAVLEALTERMQSDVQQALIDLTRDPNATVLDKLQRFFTTFDRFRMAEKSIVIQLLHVWYTDDNAIVRQKVDAAIMKWRKPLLTQIIQQGINEGTLTTPYPDLAAEIILALTGSMGSTHAGFLLTLATDHDKQRCIDGIVRSHAAYMDAVERVIGAPANAFYRVDDAAVRIWVSAIEHET